MKAGKLRHRVTIKTPLREDNRVGEPIITYVGSETRWASIRTLTEKEVVNSAQVQRLSTHELKLRYTDQIKTDCRLVYKSRVFEIDSIINVDERNRELLVMCHETRAK